MSVLLSESMTMSASDGPHMTGPVPKAGARTDDQLAMTPPYLRIEEVMSLSEIRFNSPFVLMILEDVI